jgi:catechol 2,3-dioxygenase-like lactoylglutathione lyase family enzyme
MKLHQAEGPMSSPVIKGLHHITLCASGAQDDVDFLTQALGLRLIKQTVLFEGVTPSRRTSATFIGGDVPPQA